MRHFFELAAKVATPEHLENDPRNFWLGAVGVRWDQKIVTAKNGAVHSTAVDDYQRVSLAHAEARLCRKLGKRGLVFVSRVARKDKSLVMARPCTGCQPILKAHGVKRVYYSINNFQYGVWNPLTDKDIIYEY